MKLIVGLGNPGRKYRFNRHNIGHMVVDSLGDSLNLSVTKLKFQSLWNQGQLDGEKVILVKPLTYMNRSGHAVKLWKDYFNISLSDLIIIHDDMDLASGKLRLRPKGGSGGHNGLKSIRETLQTESFPRLKMGIGRPPEQMDPASYVLGNFTTEELEIMEPALEKAIKGLKIFASEGIEQGMNYLNDQNS